MNLNRQSLAAVVQPVANHLYSVDCSAAQPTDLGLRTRAALVRMRERMENLEQSLCQAVAEKQEAKAELNFIVEQKLLVQASSFLVKKALEEERQKVSDLEAQLAAYRRKAQADQVEIDALKTQLFA